MHNFTNTCNRKVLAWILLMSASFGSLVNKYKKQKTEPSSPAVMLTVPKENTSTRAEQLQRYSITSLAFKCYEGSVTHYYHFFFGALVPVILYHLEHPLTAFRIVSDIGPFKSILCELPLNIFELLGPQVPSALAHDDKSLPHSLERGVVTLPAYDIYNSQLYHDPYVNPLSAADRMRVLDFFSGSIPAYISSIPVAPVILIQRGDDSYHANACIDRTSIYQTSGAARRSITNHFELLEALKHRFGHTSVANITLERTSIYYQYHVFSKAAVVIAQHGAALSNIFFMSSTALVVELSPPWSRSLNHFKNLAQHCKVKHVSILQQEDHSAVSIADVIDCLRDVNLENSNNSTTGRSGVNN